MKADASKVNPALAEKAFESGEDRQTLYSRCILLTYQATGNFACGFDAKDLAAWLDKYHPNAFDAKGKRIKE